MQADPLYGYFSSVAGPVSFKCFNDFIFFHDIIS